MKEKEEKEAAALFERQLRPRKRKRKLIEVESPLPTVPIYKSTGFKLSVGCVSVLLLIILYELEIKNYMI